MSDEIQSAVQAYQKCLDLATDISIKEKAGEDVSGLTSQFLQAAEEFDDIYGCDEEIVVLREKLNHEKEERSRMCHSKIVEFGKIVVATCTIDFVRSVSDGAGLRVGDRIGKGIVEVYEKHSSKMKDFMTDINANNTKGNDTNKIEENSKIIMMCSP